MKKKLAMLAAIVLCGAMMVSCNKNNGTQNPTKADMTGTWEDSFQGTANIDNSTENYTINWVLTLGGTSTLKYTAKFTTLKDVVNEVHVEDYYPFRTPRKVA